MNITCPKCSESFPVVAQAFIPRTQVLHMKLASESELLGAEVIGKAMADLAKLQIESAKSAGIKVCVFLESIELKPYEITMGLQIVQAKLC